MTKIDTEKIISVLEAAYPSFYRGKTADERRSALRLWYDMFEEDTGVEVAAAVKAFIAMDTKGYPPAIGQIKQRLAQLKNPGMPDEAQAWTLVWGAIQNSAYHAREEFDKLPPVVQKVVGKPQVLHDWAMQDASAVMTVVASNFQRAYRARAAEAAERLSLPSDIRQVLERSDFTLELPEKTDPEERRRRAMLMLAESRERQQREILGDAYDDIPERKTDDV